MTTQNALPRIFTSHLLEMKDGETLDLGAGRSILCVDDYRRTFEYCDGEGEFATRVPMAFDGNEWVSARWSDQQNQYVCSDLLPSHDNWSYAVARTASALSGVRTYKSAGSLIRRVLDRQTA